MTVSFFWNVDQKITKFHIRQKSENKTSDLDFKHFRVCSILEKTDIQIFEIFGKLTFFEIFEDHFCILSWYFFRNMNFWKIVKFKIKLEFYTTSNKRENSNLDMFENIQMSVFVYFTCEILLFEPCIWLP